MFLYIEDGIVKVTEEGMDLPVVRDLYNADKTKTKKFFMDSLKYTYYVYKKNGVYDGIFEGYRKKMVVERHLPGREIQHFEDNKRVRALITEFQNLQLTKIERFYYQLEKDIEQLIERIHSIPYTRKVKARIPVEQDGETTYVEQMVEMENYKEKTEAIMTAEKLIDYEGKLRDKILKDKTSKKKKSSQRLFDKPKE